MPSIRNQRADSRASENNALGIKTNMPTSSAEIDAAMVRVIRAALKEGRPVEMDDFRRALVPMSEIEPRFRRALAVARQRVPS